MRAPLFSQVLGQDRGVGALRAALRSGRIHHAWLFHGPAGVGKFLTARAFAGTILDPTSAPNLGAEIEPDPGSATQRLLASGTHPDLAIITKELASVSREQRVRESKQRNIALETLLEFLVEPATRAGVAQPGALARRVFVVDDAHFIAHEGHGALLKTLEEPAPGVVIVLVTDQESELPATIRSRCQRVAFAGLGDGAMRAWLERVAPEMPEARREWLLAYADGSPGRFLEGHEQGLPEWSARLRPMLDALDQGRFEPELPAEIKSLMSESAEAWVKAQGERASKDAANKAAAGRMFALLGARERASLRAGAGDRLNELERSVRAIDLLVEAERRLDMNANPELVFENLAAQLLRAGRGA